MSAPDTIVIDGHAYCWRRIVELRRRQVEEWRAARPQQPALFELRHDVRPAAQRSAEMRYKEPMLLA